MKDSDISSRRQFLTLLDVAAKTNEKIVSGAIAGEGGVLREALSRGLFSESQKKVIEFLMNYAVDSLFGSLVAELDAQLYAKELQVSERKGDGEFVEIVVTSPNEMVSSFVSEWQSGLHLLRRQRELAKAVGLTLSH